MIDTFIAIDTETTGLSFEDDRVIEIGLAIFIKGKCVRRFGIMVCNTEVENSAWLINGITGKMIEDGHDPEWAFALTSSIMHKAPRLIVGYNLPFDLSMLANEFRRHNIVYDYTRLIFIDPLVIERHHKKFALNRLVNVADRYRIPYDVIHAAGEDAEVAGHIFIQQQMRYGLSHMKPAILYAKQVGWHRTWAEEFTAYKQSRGQLVTVTQWPCPTEIECFLEGEQSLLW